MRIQGNASTEYLPDLLHSLISPAEPLCELNSGWAEGFDHALLFSDARLVITPSRFDQGRGKEYVILGHPSCETVTSPAVSVEDMVAKIQTVLGVNKSQLAGLIGVSRASLYNHIKGVEAPVDLSRYRHFYDLARAVEQGCGDTRLLHRGLKSVIVHGATMLKHLQMGSLQTTAIVELCKIVIDKVAERPNPSGDELEENRGMLHNYLARK